MKNVDTFLSKSLDNVIRKNLGDNTIHKIENRLFEKYGISLTESLTQFQKLDSVLREYFGAGADGLEEKFFKNMYIIKNVDNKNNENKSTQLQNGQCITLYDSTLTGLILEAFGDSDKKKILTSVLSESKTVYEILKDCEIPQTSGYRKVNSLINNGLLLIDGFLETQDNKKTNKYRAIFHNLEINIIKDKVTINIQINKRNIENSSIISAITRLKS